MSDQPSCISVRLTRNRQIIAKHQIAQLSQTSSTFDTIRNLSLASMQQIHSLCRQLKSTEKILDQLKAGIDSVFGKINCDRSTIAVQLGDNESVNENNMMQYLGIIEQKTNELLQIHTYLQLKDVENRPDVAAGSPPVTTTALLGGPTSPPTIQPIQIVPPSTEDDHDDDGHDWADDAVDFDRPLTQHELKARVMRNVTKKELTGQNVPAPIAAGKRGEKTAPAGDKTGKAAESFQKKKGTKWTFASSQWSVFDCTSLLPVVPDRPALQEC